jgi:hypothetical protein
MEETKSMAHASKPQARRLAANPRRHTLKTLLCAVLAATGLAAGAAHAADDWPSKPIKIIVPYTPGGSTDIVTRIVMEKLGPRLKQTIVVENRPGANSSVGSAMAAKAEPDGYTFLSMLPAYIINFHLYKLTYSPSDLTPVVQMADLPLFLFVAEDLPVKTVADLVAYARKNPDKLTYASSGNGSSAHLTGADFALQSKITMTHVAYKGSAPILTDLLGAGVHRQGALADRARHSHHGGGRPARLRHRLVGRADGARQYAQAHHRAHGARDQRDRQGTRREAEVPGRGLPARGRHHRAIRGADGEGLRALRRDHQAGEHHRELNAAGAAAAPGPNGTFHHDRQVFRLPRGGRLGHP